MTLQGHWGQDTYINIITGIALINSLSYTHQNDSCSPNNGIFNIGVKVEDPEDGHEETQIDHDGQELTSKERHDV